MFSIFCSDLITRIPLVKDLIEVTNPFHGRQAMLHCSLELMAERRYTYAVVLLLPQLEHILRLTFASVNNCSERVLTAEVRCWYDFHSFKKFITLGDDLKHLSKLLQIRDINTPHIYTQCIFFLYQNIMVVVLFLIIPIPWSFIKTPSVLW